MLYQDQPNHTPPPSNEPAKAATPPSLGICPVCESRFDRAGSSHLPFCSSRCRQIDLGRWLNESYGLPYEGEDRPPVDRDDVDEE